MIAVVNVNRTITAVHALLIVVVCVLIILYNGSVVCKTAVSALSKTNRGVGSVSVLPFFARKQN